MKKYNVKMIADSAYGIYNEVGAIGVLSFDGQIVFKTNSCYNYDRKYNKDATFEVNQKNTVVTINGKDKFLIIKDTPKKENKPVDWNEVNEYELSLKTISASEIKVGQNIRFNIDGEWKTECKVITAYLNDDNKMVIRAAHWFLILGASEQCILVND